MNNAPEHIDDEWLARYLDGGCTLEESKQIKAWIAANAENTATFEAFKKLWEVAELPVQKQPVQPSAAAHAALAKVKQRIANDANETPVVPLNPNKPTWMWVRAAAIILVVFGVSLAYFISSQDDIQTLAFETSESVKTFTLPDGSTVTLNRNSRLEYPAAFAAENREVALEGEGFFEVQRDVARPFIVEAGSAQVEVLGTSFSVSNYQDSASVVVNVATGKVKLESKTATDQHVILTPGNKGELKRNSGQVTRTEKGEPAMLFWKNKTLIFRDTALEEVFEVLNRIYKVQISAENQQINNCPLTVTFKDQSIEEILEVIANTFDLEIEKSGKTIQLHGAGC